MTTTTTRVSAANDAAPCARGAARILVVDDDPAARTCLEKLLRGSGFATSLACDGRDALEEAARRAPDMVLADLHMPTMGGAELCQRLRGLDPGLPVVVTTSDGDAAAVIASLRAGARDYLLKPLDFDAVLSCVDRVLKERSPRPLASAPALPDVVDATPALRAGKVVGERYRLLRRLGRGGMSEVWLAEHLSLGTEVALKFLLPSCDAASLQRARRMFHVEAQLSAQLGALTRHVVQVHDTGSDDAGPYLVMEYVRGHSLDALLRQGAIDVEAFAAILDQVSDALEVVHAHGVVHRDIKPGNILVAIGDDGALTAKLADFGVAAVTGPGLALDEPPHVAGPCLVGTAGYMSPEQSLGEDVDARSDIWSLGVVAHEALTGAQPLSASRTTRADCHAASSSRRAPSTLRSDLPPELDAWFERALATRRELRFVSAVEMARSFRASLAPPPPSVRREGPCSVGFGIPNRGAAQ